MTTGAHCRSEKKASRYDASSLEFQFLTTFRLRSFGSQLWPMVSKIVCPFQRLAPPEPPVSCSQHRWSLCLVLLGNSRGRLSMARTTYFVSFEPVCHGSLNKVIEALLFSWYKRGLFFSTWFECFVCISKSESFCLFCVCVRLKTENLPTQENCSDALKRM